MNKTLNIKEMKFPTCFNRFIYIA